MYKATLICLICPESKVKEETVYGMASNNSGHAQTTRITYREATLEDYHDVLDINQHVYSGLDYLPAKYHTFIADPNCTPYVAVVDGQIVRGSFSEL